MLWTAPNTALGMVAGSIGVAFGAHAHLRPRDLALVFHRMPWGPGGALTLGNIILHTGDTLDSPCVTYAHRAGHGDEPAIVLADHERAVRAWLVAVVMHCSNARVAGHSLRADERSAHLTFL